MAPPNKKPSNRNNNQKPTHPKLPRLSEKHKISKRPLIHPPIANPHRSTSTLKVVYISNSTPFISSVKRVRKLLSAISASSSSAPPIDFSHGDSTKILRDIEAGVIAQENAGKRRNAGDAVGGEEVILKGTGRAIEKVLKMVIYWQGQEDVVVRVRTGSVGAIDDVVSTGSSHGRENEDGDGEGGGDGEEEEEEQGSRIRRTSCIEVGISLR